MQPSEPKSLIERQVKKAPAKAAPAGDATAAEPVTPNNRGEELQSSDFTDAAAILTAVDEDEEDAEEAQVPEAFDYYTDPEDADEME